MLQSTQCYLSKVEDTLNIPRGHMTRMQEQTAGKRMSILVLIAKNGTSVVKGKIPLDIDAAEEPP